MTSCTHAHELQTDPLTFLDQYTDVVIVPYALHDAVRLGGKHSFLQFVLQRDESRQFQFLHLQTWSTMKRAADDAAIDITEEALVDACRARIRELLSPITGLTSEENDAETARLYAAPESFSYSGYLTSLCFDSPELNPESPAMLVSSRFLLYLFFDVTPVADRVSVCFHEKYAFVLPAEILYDNCVMDAPVDAAVTAFFDSYPNVYRLLDAATGEALPLPECLFVSKKTYPQLKTVGTFGEPHSFCAPAGATEPTAFWDKETLARPRYSRFYKYADARAQCVDWIEVNPRQYRHGGVVRFAVFRQNSCHEYRSDRNIDIADPFDSCIYFHCDGVGANVEEPTCVFFLRDLDQQIPLSYHIYHLPQTRDDAAAAAAIATAAVTTSDPFYDTLLLDDESKDVAEDNIWARLENEALSTADPKFGSRV